MGTWNKETQLVSMYFGDYFYEYGPHTATTMRAAVEEHIMGNLEGLARELMLTSLSNVDWEALAEIYNEEEVLFDEL